MQISLFDGNKPFKITKPIRLIELFAGYGSQHFALEYLGVEFESWKICEWAVKSIQAYRDAHCWKDLTDYSRQMTQEQVIDYLYSKGISSNYNEPMTLEQVKRLGEEKQRKIYNNIQATHNLVNIQQANGDDLEIVDTDKYCYVMTYSFPCQDLSLAGKQAGMEKGSGTRSGMLWEVERILDELNRGGQKSLPQVLLMENVPEVIGTNNVKHFAKWLEKLESLGYKCYWKVLNAKDYGVPQNRERCFMVSVLGDYFYEFPAKIKLERKLKDLLEKNVNKKYYLSDSGVRYVLNRTPIGKKDNRANNIIGKDAERNAGTITTSTTYRGEDNYIIDNMTQDEIDKNIYLKNIIGCEIRTDEGIRTFNDNLMGTLRTIDACGSKHIIEFGSYYTWKNNKGEINTQCNRANNPNNCALTIDCHTTSKVLQNCHIRKLTPNECFRLMGVKDDDFGMIAINQSDASLYHLAGDSIVVNVLMSIFKEIL